MEGQSKEPRRLEAYCRGGQNPPGAVVLFGRKVVVVVVVVLKRK
jgi:hypothetical protein